MSSSGQEAATESIERDSRVGNALYLNESAYQTDFKKLFKKNCKVNMEPKGYQFSFLKDGSAVKAIHVVLTDDRGVKYPKTFAADVNQ